MRIIWVSWAGPCTKMVMFWSRNLAISSIPIEHPRAGVGRAAVLARWLSRRIVLS